MRTKGLLLFAILLSTTMFAQQGTKNEKGRKAEWTFSIYNVYCRQNPYYYYYGDPKGDPLYWNQFPNEPQTLWQRSFFPIIPSFSYKVWF